MGEAMLVNSMGRSVEQTEVPWLNIKQERALLVYVDSPDSVFQ